LSSLFHLFTQELVGFHGALVTTLQHKLMNISDVFLFFFLFFFFFTVVFLTFSWKTNATHSSSKPRPVVWRQGDSYFENDGRGPYYTNNWLIPSTGLLVFIYSREERAFTEPGSREVEWLGESERLSILVDFGGWLETIPLPPLSDFEMVSPLQQGQMVLLTYTWVSALEDVYSGGEWVNSGASVHSVGRATVVSHPLFSTTLCHPRSYTLHPTFSTLRPSLPVASSCKWCPASSLTRQTDGRQRKDFISQKTTSLYYWVVILKKKKEKKKMCYCLMSINISTSG